jgi:hypothetical protein
MRSAARTAEATSLRGDTWASSTAVGVAASDAYVRARARGGGGVWLVQQGERPN